VDIRYLCSAYLLHHFSSVGLHRGCPPKAHEQSTVLLVPTGKAKAVTHTHLRHPEHVQRQILHTIVRLWPDLPAQTDLDATLVRTAVAAIRAYFSDDETLMDWVNSVRTPGDNLLVDCEVCPADRNSAIGLVSTLIPLGAGKCREGHQLARCSVTFM
jgi:hypothetical protein